MDFAGFVVALVGGTEDFAAQTRREILDRRVIEYQPPRCDGLLLINELPPCTKGRSEVTSSAALYNATTVARPAC